MRIRDTMSSLFTAIGFLVVLAVLSKVFLFEIIMTSSYSMVPTIIAGDTFLVYKHADLDVGDTVVCHHPDTPSTMVVGRILATEGMTLSLKNDVLTLDKHAIQRQSSGEVTYFDYTNDDEVFEYTLTLSEESTGGNSYTVGFIERSGNRNLREVQVSRGHVFLLGDNRNRAVDSRHFGEVPIENCIGEAFVIVWPAEDSGDFKRWERLPDLVE